jgi:transposase-like protein
MGLKLTDDIICPYCGMYYTLEEVFIMRELSKGNMKEEFICEDCGNKFLITAQIKYNIKKAENTIVKNETIIMLDDEVID